MVTYKRTSVILVTIPVRSPDGEEHFYSSSFISHLEVQ